MFVAHPQSGSEGNRAVKGAAKPAHAETTESQDPLYVTAEERHRMIAEAAYLRAADRGFFMGDAVEDWLAAELEIDQMLQQDTAPPMSAKQRFQQTHEAQLKEWDAKLDALKARVHDASLEIRADFQKQLALLDKKRAVARAKIHELSLRTDRAWEDLMSGVEKTGEELHKALDKMMARFK